MVFLTGTDYGFGHASDVKFLPRGHVTINQPTVRLFKPLDELNTQDFNVDSLENFIEVSSVPIVTIFNKDPTNHPYIMKFFNSPHAKDGSLTPFTKSDPIPKVNDEPVKIAVANNLKDVVFNSRKNVLLDFYAPWCEHCKKLAPILDEVVVSFLDGSTNGIPSEFELREVWGYPTVYFSSATNKIMLYDGDRTAEAIINLIEKNWDTAKETLDKEIPVQSNSGKDEL
ncbi:hypothetical protein J5N97_021141 [Dioscorea zingiberensis]|uniref:protein disulfide-isomerase n=1 Tax=Dioscorea zingiberensis TaxID=325984 RepID=A0A9D5CIG5_9LILI|nr:hypothetical protein J5N97_021141 [Dioscorea zingiberensis]